MIDSLRSTKLTLMCVGVTWLSAAPTANGADRTSIQFDVRDERSELMPCRVHLRDHNRQPIRAEGMPFWNDHFVCGGFVTVNVPPGDYAWDIERGPEYTRRSGNSTVKTGNQARVSVALKRIANLRSEGWASGDLHVHRSVSEIKRLMLAEDLHFAPVIGWWNTPAPNAKAGRGDRISLRW